LHLDVYTKELKNLIVTLNDNTLNAVYHKAQNKNNKKNENKDHVKSPDQLKLLQQNTQYEKESEKTNEGNKKTKMRANLEYNCMEESLNFFENNCNAFCNGVSLLAVNSLECHGILHQQLTQSEVIMSLTRNINVHNKLMREKV